MKKILLLFLICFCAAGTSYAFDWKSLHEEADKISLEQALAKVGHKPDSSEALYVLGLVYLNLHKDQEAQKAFDTMLRSNPGSMYAKWAKAELMRRRHNLDEAESALNEVIKETPQFLPAYLTLAYIKFTKTDFEAAAKLTTKVMRQGKANIDLSNYVRAMLLFGGAKGMIAHYGGPVSKLINGAVVYPNLQKAQRLQPETAGVKYGLGAFYLLAPVFAGGDIKKAEQYLIKATQADPLFPDAFVRLAQVYKLKGDNQKYQECIDKALEIDPGNELALDIKLGECKFICLDKKG